MYSSNLETSDNYFAKALTVTDFLLNGYNCFPGNDTLQLKKDIFGYLFSFFLQLTLWKCLRIRSVISVNYHYITVVCPFNLLIRFKCYNTV